MWNLDIESIGGIRAGSTTIEDGLNVVQASNFQGKSSLIAAIQTVMGSTGHYEDHPITEGAESASVSLEMGEETYEVTIEQNSPRSYPRGGNPYLTDETEQKTARLFAFLGENNPVRTAVRNGEDLTEFLQEPLNIDEIDQEIDALIDDRQQLRIELEQAEKASERIPKVQETITQLEKELEELREQKDELEDVSEAKEEADELSGELSDRQSDLETVEREIERLQSDIQNKEADLEAKREELDALEVPEIPELSNIEEKQDRVSSLEADISLFEELYRANKNVLESADLDTLTNVERTLSGDELECWVCGESAPKDQMESRIERIDERVSALREEKEELVSEIDEFEERKREAEQKHHQRDQLENKVGSLRQEIDEKKADLKQAKKRRDELQSAVVEIETELEEVEEEYSEELTDLKTEIRNRERQLERQQDELEELEERQHELDHLQQKEEELTDQIEELRRQKTETQHQLRDEFETAMDDIIARFSPGFEKARLDAKTNQEGEIEEFELIIAREGRETTVDALSEGEVELIGVAAALAGYRVYDVDEIVPCILIDGISQLASEHLRGLIDYLEDTADIFVTTAYPEAGEFDGQIINPDSWNVVSDGERTAA